MGSDIGGKANVTPVRNRVWLPALYLLAIRQSLLLAALCDSCRSYGRTNGMKEMDRGRNVEREAWVREQCNTRVSVSPRT